MKQNKFIRILEGYLKKLGDVEVFRLIDKYYRETYEGATGWKVRQVVRLSDIIRSGVTPITEIVNGFNGRRLLGFLEKYNGPIDMFVKYDDSYERWKMQNEERARKERNLGNALDHAYTLFRNPYAIPFLSRGV